MSSSVLAPFCQLEPHVLEHEHLGEGNDYTAETEEDGPRHGGYHASTDPPLNYLNLRVNQASVLLQPLIGGFSALIVNGYKDLCMRSSFADLISRLSTASAFKGLKGTSSITDHPCQQE